MSLTKDLILGEIGGKNAAIHAYDKVIWTIRSGYLTLLYGGWSIVIKALIDEGGDFAQSTEFLVMMLFISLGLTVGALILDQNYLRRKFRVIASLNKLLPWALSIGNLEDLNEVERTGLMDTLRVAGDADNKTYRTDGFRQAVKAEIAVYSVSILTLLIGAASVLLMRR